MITPLLKRDMIAKSYFRGKKCSLQHIRGKYVNNADNRTNCSPGMAFSGARKASSSKNVQIVEKIHILFYGLPVVKSLTKAEKTRGYKDEMK